MALPLNFPLLVIAALISCVGPVHAHNSDVSSARVRMDRDARVLYVEVEMSAEAAMALYGIPMRTQGIPPNRDDILPPLRRAAPEIYRFAIADANLELRDRNVEFREEDGIAFLLTFALPVDLPVSPSLEFNARYLEHLGASHRAAITLVDAQGGVGPGRMLSLEQRSGMLPLPQDG